MQIAQNEIVIVKVKKTTVIYILKLTSILKITDLYFWYEISNLMIHTTYS